MFAKRLKNVGVDVKLDLLAGLPHGFLNFSLVRIANKFINIFFYKIILDI